MGTSAETAIKDPARVLAITIPFVTMNPPLVANVPELTSTLKSTPPGAGAGVGDEESSLEQLVDKPAIQAGNKTAAAPKPALAKNSFLFII